jgi:16S rRNA (uracil1498-N3)-methyltransferase
MQAGKCYAKMALCFRPTQEKCHMELRHTPRLFMDVTLAHGLTLEPPSEQTHYLLHVLRLKSGDVVRLFNGQNGEWKATATGIGKRSLTLTVGEQTRNPGIEPDLWLCAAPIKKAHFEYMIEKATELGIAVLQPILTARTQIREVNLDRARSIAVEAAEQSERLTIPTIKAPMRLHDLVSNWSLSRQLIVCAEWGEAAPIKKTLAELPKRPAAILTGPEGGLAAEELNALRALSSAMFVRLGPRILRADTAGIAALANWQALCGDWQS